MAASPTTVNSNRSALPIKPFSASPLSMPIPIPIPILFQGRIFFVRQPPGQSFDDRSLSDAGIPNQERIIFRLTAQRLHNCKQPLKKSISGMRDCRVLSQACGGAGMPVRFFTTVRNERPTFSAK